MFRRSANRSLHRISLVVAARCVERREHCLKTGAAFNITLPERHDDTATHYERASNKDRVSRPLMELQLRHNLGDYEEDHNVKTEKSTEVNAR